MKSKSSEGRIVLINPWQYSEKEIISRVWPPLCLANCAALLRERGFDVAIIDANAEKLKPEKVARVVEGGGPKKVFITSTPIDRWQCPYIDLRPFVECARAVRKVCEKTGAELYVMGTHGTLEPEKVLDATEADAVIVGEPELTVLELCKKNNENSLKDVKGVCYREKGKIAIRNRKRFLDLGKLPTPAFDLLPMKKYFYELLGSHFTLLETSRGCPFGCVFCMKKMYNGFCRKKSLGKVIKELEYAIDSGVKNVYFIDLELTVNRNLVVGLCDFLIKKRNEEHGLSWCCQTRADTVDKELLEKMHEAGCRLIHFGVESGSQRMLKIMNKGATLERIEEGVKAAMDAGIEAACFFMLGLPTETEDEMKETIEFAKKLNPTYASFHVAIPYTGTKFGGEYGTKSCNEAKFFPLCDPSRDYDELRAATKKAYLKFYLRPSYVINAFRRNPKILAKQFKLFLRYMR